MSPDPASEDEDRFASLLAACDEALAGGGPPALPGDAPSQTRRRVEESLSCLHLLRRLLPERPAADPAPSPPDGALWGLDLGRPPVWFGRFRVLGELGRGGFGIVLLADDPLLGRQVALKVPRGGALMSPDLRERFLREARTAARLEHPNLASVYEASAVGPICYMISAYCPGPNLAVWLKGRTEPPPYRTAAAWTAALADGVQHAHHNGVLHRDVKPSNVLLTPRRDVAAGSDDLGFTPRLTDFGLAKVLEEDGDQTTTGVIVGTAPYMAPEQAEGRSAAVGPATDTYALGAILCELLTGYPPLQGATLLATLEQVRSGRPTPPRSLREGVPADLETICLKCLHKSPGDRYASAGALADDLRRYLAGEPIQTRPFGWLEKGWNWCRRPERIRDADVVAAVATAFDSLMPLSGVGLLLAGLLPLEPSWQRVGFFLATVCLAALPMAVITRYTLRQDVRALWAGAVLPCVVAVWLGVASVGAIDSGEMATLNGPTTGLATFVAIGLVQGCQVASFALALVAHYANRPPRGSPAAPGWPAR